MEKIRLIIPLVEIPFVIAIIIISGCASYDYINYINPEFDRNRHSRLNLINKSSTGVGLQLYKDPVNCSGLYSPMALNRFEPKEIITNLGEPITLQGGYWGGVDATGMGLVLKRCYIAITAIPKHQEYDVYFDFNEEGCSIQAVSKQKREKIIEVKRNVITASSMDDPWCQPISFSERIQLGLEE